MFYSFRGRRDQSQTQGMTNSKLNGLIYLHKISNPGFGGQSSHLSIFQDLSGMEN